MALWELPHMVHMMYALRGGEPPDTGMDSTSTNTGMDSTSAAFVLAKRRDVTIGGWPMTVGDLGVHHRVASVCRNLGFLDLRGAAPPTLRGSIALSSRPLPRLVDTTVLSR